ncbi:MAG: hypothetical protein IT236_00050 [Bacteroidia bacterium]|nr:hypothetical protein [Bacteroidia bacterium]
MKKQIILFAGISLFLSYCQNAEVDNESNKTKELPKPFLQKLFITLESSNSDKCGAGGTIDDGLNGCLYLTKKGNAIYHLNNEKEDTVSYLSGKYTHLDSTIQIELNNEYYYAGKWDARWDIENPDYKKGVTRKIVTKKITIHKSPCDTDSYYQPYSVDEINEATKRLKNQSAGSLYYMPYYDENKDMKFYSWLLKQIPPLAEL